MFSAQMMNYLFSSDKKKDKNLPKVQEEQDKTMLYLILKYNKKV